MQKEIDRIQSFLPISIEEKVKYTQRLLGDLAVKFVNEPKNFVDGSHYLHERNSVLQTLNDETNTFTPRLPSERLLQYLPNIRYVTVSSCGTKLKKIAKVV